MSHIPQDFRPPPSLDALHRDFGVDDPHRGLQAEDHALLLRPLGVKLITVWHLISALLWLLAGYAEFRASLDDRLRELVEQIGVFYILGVVINLFVGAGLWELARWARYLALVTSVLAILFRLAVGSRSALDLVLAIISAAIIYYLLRPGTRARFERPSA